MSEPVLVDARGLRCPWPAIRAARALRDGAAALVVLADDPSAELELARLAEGAGRRIEPAGEARFHIG